MRLIRPWWRRFWIVAIAIVLAVGALRSDLPDTRELGSRFLALESWTTAHRGLAVLALAAILFVSAALALPIGGMLTAIAGSLLGGVVAGSTAVLTAPAGALVLFGIVRRTVFADRLRGWLEARLEPFVRGFRSDAAPYLVCLRLMPTPFWLVNIAAAMLGVRWRTFLWTTALGIIPMTFAHAFAGAAIGNMVRAHHKALEGCAAGDASLCASQLSFTGLISPSTLLAFAALGLLALLPVLIRKMLGRPRAGA